MAYYDLNNPREMELLRELTLCKRKLDAAYSLLLEATTYVHGNDALLERMRAAFAGHDFMEPMDAGKGGEGYE